MSVSFVSRKCTSCGGKIEYLKDKKLWRCLYCGAEIEREEKYDGLFTIKNVVLQTLADVAYRRLESASKNLLECEKINSRYIGTIIARLSFQMITAITPGACQQHEIQNLLTQIKLSYRALSESNPRISDEEEALYEFFDNPDVYATLSLVYDSLNDILRRDYIFNLLNISEVYSIDSNMNLLSYFLKNGRYDQIDSIISNNRNIDKKSALIEVLNRYPEGDQKTANVEVLLEAGALKPEEKQVVEKYLAESKDSTLVKGKIAVSSCSIGVRPGLESIIENVLANADSTTTEAVLLQFCSSRLSDLEVEMILQFAFNSKSTDLAIAALSCLKSSGQFAMPTSKHFVSFLSRKDLNVDDKIKTLKKSLEFNIDNKSKEATINYYLCFNDDDAETRAKIIPELLESLTLVTTNSLENYVLKCSADGANKPKIVDHILKKQTNTSFFYDLLSKYINSDIDSTGIRLEVIDRLIEKGLKVDPISFSQYVYAAKDEVQIKMDLIKKLQANGSQLRNDATSTYLETVSPGCFSPELFTSIFNSTSSVSNKALCNYILYCNDRDALKAKNVATLALQNGSSLSSLSCEVNHLGNSLNCNIAQAYVLMTGDSYPVAREIVNYFISAKVKINDEIRISDRGPEKFKKYVSSNRGKLSKVTEQLCEENRLFGSFFNSIIK